MSYFYDLRVTPNNRPVIGWENVLQTASFSSTGARTGSPAAAARSYQTYEGWGPPSGVGRLTATFSTTAVGYVGALVLGASSGARAQLYTSSGSTWTAQGWGIPGQGALIWAIPEGSRNGVRVEMYGGGGNARIVNLMAGPRLELERSLYVGHSPATLSRVVTKAGSISESGQYLGQIKRRVALSSGVSVQNLSPRFVREQLMPFFEADTQPHYFAWRAWISTQSRLTTESGEYLTTESGDRIMVLDNGSTVNEPVYAWLPSAPIPVNARPNGMMDANWSLQGIEGRS